MKSVYICYVLQLIESRNNYDGLTSAWKMNPGCRPAFSSAKHFVVAPWTVEELLQAYPEHFRQLSSSTLIYNFCYPCFVKL